MRSCPAEIETTGPGEPIPSMTEEGPPGKELVEGVLSVHRVAACQAVFALEVSWRDDMAADDLLGDPR